MAAAPSAGNPILRFGVFELDTQTGELRKSGRTIRLRPQAAKVLTVLACRPDQLVTREELKDQIWGQDTFVDFEHGLNLCIQQIRATLDDDADVPRYIETLPRRGYRFIAPVQDSSQEQALGRYRITGKIGAGGMGEVYLAQDTRLGREVAIKVLPLGALQDENARNRFWREAEILSKLSHPNIATVYDFERQQGRDLLVMEYVRGVTLSDKLAAGPLPEKGVLRLGLQLTEGIEAAHEHGVIHRDLKPGNLRVTPEGWLKILDFGLARSVLSACADFSTMSVAETGSVEGTLRYMAPEQLLAQSTDARTDIFTVGSILYEMATGQAPFYNQLATVLVEAILHQRPRPPRQLNSAISVRLEDIILKCLEKEPANRYQSAKELAVDLRRLAAASQSFDEGAGLAQPQATTKKIVAGALVMTAAVLAVAGLGWWTKTRVAKTVPVNIGSLAVLPLENLSKDPEQDYFADGMTDELITALAKIQSLRVISRNSVMPYKGKHDPVPQIGRELKVDAVIEGTVERSGNRVRIRAQLIETTTDRHLWAQAYEGDLRDILKLQEQVALAIATEIKGRLAPEEQVHLTSSKPVNPDAHEADLHGFYELHKHGAAGSFLPVGSEVEKAITFFQLALSIDPRDALAYAGLADAYYDQSTFFRAPLEVMPKAKAAAMKAIELDDSVAEAHASLGYVKLTFDWDWAGAGREFRRALELNPNLASGHAGYAHYLLTLGRSEEAIRELGQLKNVDPLFPQSHVGLPYTLWNLRLYEQAVEEAKKVGDERVIALSRIEQGRLDEAVAAADRGMKVARNPVILAQLAYVYARGGMKNKARTILSGLEAQVKQRYVCGFNVACLYTGLGDKEQAYAWLERAYRDRSD